MKAELRPLQREAVAKARPFDGFAFISEQRTGKTVILFAVAEERKPKVLLIVCPPGKPVAEWHRQFRKLIEDPESYCDVYIVGFQEFYRHRKRWRRWCKRQTDVMMVVDEAHRTKKRSAAWARAVHSVGFVVRWRFALTGTPIAQGIQDAWSLFRFIQPEVFGSYADFEDEYLKVVRLEANGKQWKKIKGPKEGKLHKFYKLYHKYTFRFTLNEARQEAGKNSIKTRRVKIPVQLEPLALRYYKEIDEELETMVGENIVEVSERLGVAMKLQQICGGFLKDIDGNWVRVGTEKLRALRLLLKKQTKKVTVVCRFLREIEEIKWLIENTLKKTVKVLKGGSEYSGVLGEDVCIIQVQSGVSIDLSMAQIIIFYSCDYSYIDYEQIRYRIRSYDTNQVEEYFLICTDTVDEDIYEAVRNKKVFAELINDRYRRQYNAKLGVASTTGKANASPSTN